jgi:hypothetical protein
VAENLAALQRLAGERQQELAQLADLALEGPLAEA